MEVKVTHTGKMKFKMQARQHGVGTDQPAEIGGEDTAMTPPEIFLAALGAVIARGGDHREVFSLVRPGMDVDVEWRRPGAPGHAEAPGAGRVYPDPRPGRLAPPPARVPPARCQVGDPAHRVPARRSGASD